MGIVKLQKYRKEKIIGVRGNNPEKIVKPAPSSAGGRPHAGAWIETYVLLEYKDIA